MLRKIKVIPTVIIKALRAINQRDIMIIAGLGLSWYGLYLFREWVAYAVVGMVLILMGIVKKD